MYYNLVLFLNLTLFDHIVVVRVSVTGALIVDNCELPGITLNDSGFSSQALDSEIEKS